MITEKILSKRKEKKRKEKKKEITNQEDKSWSIRLSYKQNPLHIRDWETYKSISCKSTRKLNELLYPNPRCMVIGFLRSGTLPTSLFKKCTTNHKSHTTTFPWSLGIYNSFNNVKIKTSDSQTKANYSSKDTHPQDNKERHVSHKSSPIFCLSKYSIHVESGSVAVAALCPGHNKLDNLYNVVVEQMCPI